MPVFTHDVIVIGHGLAGAVISHQLRARGAAFHVFDVAQSGSASRAAAGVVNPISLRRDIATWRAPEMLDHATRFYTAMEAAYGRKFWHPLELIKVFANPAGAGQWERSLARPENAGFLSPVTTDQPACPIPAPHGHGLVRQCAWLDLRAMLSIQRAWLQDQGDLTERSISEEHIEAMDHGVAIGDVSAPWIIHCAGPFSSVPGLIPVNGEVITVRIPELRCDHIIHHGVFILPIGDQLFRVGSTFKWRNVWEGPSQEGLDHLMDKLARAVPYPIELIEHRAGVRPTSKDRRPLIGMTGPHQAMLNGLGSRGAMLAPWCADHLLAHILDGAPLDPEVDLERALVR